MAPARPMKIVVIGDSLVGKSTLLTSFTQEKFPIVDIHECNIVVGGKDYDLILWDTIGTHDYERIRHLIYPKVDCFLLCYSIGSHTSFANIKSQWLPEVKEFFKNIPIVLVGNKLDLRIDDSEKFVTQGQGFWLRDEMHAYSLVECSALKKSNLSAVFEDAVRAIEQKNPRRQSKKKKCNIL